MYRSGFHEYVGKSDTLNMKVNKTVIYIVLTCHINACFWGLCLSFSPFHLIIKNLNIIEETNM